MKWTTAMYVLPSHETVERLKDILRSSPIALDFPSMRVELARTARPNSKWVAHPEATYEARFLDFGLWTPSHNKLLLVGSLECQEMSLRMNSLVQSPSLPVPRLIFNDNSPTLSHSNKSFIASVYGSLVDRSNEQMFTFEREVRIDNPL